MKKILRIFKWPAAVLLLAVIVLCSNTEAEVKSFVCGGLAAILLQILRLDKKLKSEQYIAAYWATVVTWTFMFSLWKLPPLYGLGSFVVIEILNHINLKFQRNKHAHANNDSK